MPSAFFSLSFCAVLPCCCSVLYRVSVRGGGVRSPGEVGVLVHPPLGECVKALCVIVLMVAQHCTQLGSLALKQKNLPDAGHFIVVPLASIPSLVAFFQISFSFFCVNKC